MAGKKITIRNSSIKDDLKEIPEWYSCHDGKFPREGIERLKTLELMALNVPLEFGGRGIGNGSGNRELLETLKKIGAHDLSLGRIYEGHINALLLIATFGTREQKREYLRQAVSGKLFGIWNSELPSEPLTFKPLQKSFHLKGAKVFCSGASNVDRPIVTAEGPQGSYMVILHLDDYEIPEDYTYWRPLGMKSSVSCRFDLTGKTFPQKQILGNPSDYVQEPDFSGGSVRFAAVQLGGAEAAIRETIRHLERLGRIGAPEQIMRLARLSILRETGTLWLEGAGRAMDKKQENPSGYKHFANMFRTVTREICEEVLKVCEMSVGLQGMMKPHPLERIHRDLSVYLKQPGPDRVFTEVGKNFIETYPCP